MIVRSSNGKIALAFSVAAVVWLGLSGTLFGLKLADGMQFGCAYAVLAIFVLFGALLALWAASQVVRWLRFRDSRLELDGEVISMGTELQARLHFARPFRPRGEMVLNPRCIRHDVLHYGGRQPSRSSSVTVLWREEKRVHLDASATRLPVPIRLDLPSGLPAASPPGDSGGIHWQLEVTVPARFVDFHATFELPVTRGTG